MKIRAAKFVAAIVASILSSANLLAAPENAEQAADKCLTSPGEKTPPGGHWRYRIERGSGRQCWYLKADADKATRKAPVETTAVEEPAPPPPRAKAAPPRSLSDARAELSRTQIEPGPGAAPDQRAPVPSPALAGDSGRPSLVRDANMMAPGAAARWPDPMSAANPAAGPTTAAADQGADVRPSPAASAAPAQPKAMPRAVPPIPPSEKPLSLPMLITIVAGGLSVTGMIVSMLFGWRASRPHLTPSAPMPALDDPRDDPRRPGDLYRERMRIRAAAAGRRHAA